MTSPGNKCKFPNHGQSRGKNGMFQSTIDNCYCSRKMSTLRMNDVNLPVTIRPFPFLTNGADFFKACKRPKMFISTILL